MNADSSEEAKSTSNVKFFSNSLLKVGALGIVWYIAIYIGFERFFIGIGIAPLDTVAQMVGALSVPIVPSYFIARYLSRHKEDRFLPAWIIGTCIILGITTMGI